MNTSPPILTVSQLNRHVRHILEDEVGEIHVEGEISNLSKPSSGHFYFTLKDATAQLRCVYFKNRHNAAHLIDNGSQIIARGCLSLYEARGDYQLIIEELKPAGQGDLFRQFEALKQKLKQLGLFEIDRKKTLPKLPICIGIITSPTSAAIRDILTTLARRYSLAKICVYPSEVQGSQAATQLIEKIRLANIEKKCDVLILARGGGSIEDLWAFNNEQLAYAIRDSFIPIITGIGHETDFTIADFVADLRAATPTAAAETATPNSLDITANLQNLQSQMIGAITRRLHQHQLSMKYLLSKLGTPSHLIFTQWQHLDALSHRMQLLSRALIQKRSQELELLHTQLLAAHPGKSLIQYKSRLEHIQSFLKQLILRKLEQKKQTFITTLSTLNTVSPLATLERGYAIVTHNEHIIF